MRTRVDVNFRCDSRRIKRAGVGIKLFFRSLFSTALLKSIRRIGLGIATIFLIPGITFGNGNTWSDAAITERLKKLEALSSTVSRDAELALQLYQMAMNMAIEEARVEFLSLRYNQSVQQCSTGVDRASSCLVSWQDATKILDAAFVRRNVSGTSNEFRLRVSQIADFANRSGAFEKLPTANSNEGIIGFVIDSHRLKKCGELQNNIIQTLTSLGNALINNSSILISTRAILEPMRLMAERPSNERVDIVWILLSGLDGAQAELNRTKIEPSSESKASLRKLFSLRNLGVSSF